MKGLILVNLGTPEEPTPKAVNKFLKEFLSDPRVVDSAIVRNLILKPIVIPKRSKKSAEAYESIWMEEGSPLMVYSKKLLEKVRYNLAGEYLVELAMRYGEPSIEGAFESFKGMEVDEIFVLPLYPQSTLSTTQSVIDKVREVVKKQEVEAPVKFLPNFYRHDEFILPFAQLTKEALEKDEYEHLIFSFHGVPQSHISQVRSNKSVCMMRENCCDEITSENRFCYRAQCFDTARKIASRLNLSSENYSVTFQSRLGRAKWTEPYFKNTLEDIAYLDLKKVLVICPSFVADCLESLEEIAISYKEEFQELGGEVLDVVPCLNDNDLWAEGIPELINKYQSRWQEIKI